jgi:hypothetical protein
MSRKERLNFDRATKGEGDVQKCPPEAVPHPGDLFRREPSQGMSRKERPNFDRATKGERDAQECPSRKSLIATVTFSYPDASQRVCRQEA